MKLTVLFDLDDTLITNDMNAFLPAYLQALGAYMSGAVRGITPDQVIREVMKATQKLIAKDTPALTMEQVFDQNFYPGLKIEKEDIRADIENFYRDIFPTVRSVTQARPEAVKAVEYAFSQGWRVVIATNPLFPSMATNQRLAWAGLPVDKYSFELVTTYEGFHYCKPHPAYYAEILAQIGWPDDPVVVIGNSLEDEILPADKLGIPGFWLVGSSDDRCGGQLPDGLHPLTRSGCLEDIIPWLKKVSESGLELKLDSATAIQSVLQSTPASLDTMVRKLNKDVLKQKPQSNEWSITEILCHLRDVDEEVNWPRLLKVCEEENPFFPGVVTDPWAEERDYYHQDGAQALVSFIQVRSKIVQLLGALSPDLWQKSARHAIFGPTTIQDLTQFISTHDRLHVRQIYDTIQLASRISTGK